MHDRMRAPTQVSVRARAGARFGDATWENAKYT